MRLDPIHHATRWFIQAEQLFDIYTKQRRCRLYAPLRCQPSRAQQSLAGLHQAVSLLLTCVPEQLLLDKRRASNLKGLNKFICLPRPAMFLQEIQDCDTLCALMQASQLPELLLVVL